MTATTLMPGAAAAPGLARRLACFVYEGVLLFGLVMMAGLLYGIVTQQKHALVGAMGLRIYLFIVLGVYFVWFWSRHGQTLAMRTWRLQIVTASGARPGVLRATCRYLLCWLWFLPALLALYFSGLKGSEPAFAALAAGVLAYAGLSRLHPERQYLHDAACGTQVVDWQPPVRR
jgi:uncharacterized RDD family membrane protein YckC